MWCCGDTATELLPATRLAEKLKAGANVNRADSETDRTALHLACSDGKVNAARVLLELGADPMKLDRWRGTPLDDARRGGKSELVELVTSFCTPA